MRNSRFFLRHPVWTTHCVLNVCEFTCFRLSVSLAYTDLLYSFYSVSFITSLYYLMLEVISRCGSKGKFHPRTGHEDPEGEQIYNSTLPSTSTLDGVGCKHHAPAALPPGKTRYPLYMRLGGPHGRSGRERKISTPPGFDPRVVHPVASRYTD